MNEDGTIQSSADSMPRQPHSQTAAESDALALDEILPSDSIELAASDPPSRNFKPWHLPRKQHIRRAQWGKAFAQLLEHLPDRRLIKYLCLPGEDLLDVEVLAEICRENSRQIKYLGFDQSMNSAGRSTQRAAAEQIVRQTKVIDEESIVLPDDFTSIAREKSIGRGRLRDGGSYDVVNLDMCDAFTTDEWAPVHAALLELMTHQANRRGEPWLLFLTTRSEVAKLKRQEVTAYADRIAANARQSAAFRETLSQLAGGQSSDVDKLIEAVTRSVENSTLVSGKWLAIGIGKWLLGVMARGEPWRVDILSTYCYRTGLLSEKGAKYATDPPNLFSLVFRFEKIRYAREDPMGIVAQRAQSFSTFSEVQLAEKLAKAVVQHTIDLDQFMSADPNRRSEMQAECESRLSVRYYSVDDYRELVSRLPSVAVEDATPREDAATP